MNLKCEKCKGIFAHFFKKCKGIFMHFFLKSALHFIKAHRRLINQFKALL